MKMKVTKELGVYKFKRTGLGEEDIDKLVNAADGHQQKLIIFGLLETGMRVGEFASLTKENFKWQKDRIIVDGKGGPFGKRSKKRVIPLSTRARTIFEAHFTMNDTIPWSIKTIERVVERVAEKAGITTRVTPHVLRHSFAHICIRRNIPLPVVQRIMGHSSILITMQYLRLSENEVCTKFQEMWGRRN